MINISFDSIQSIACEYAELPGAYFYAKINNIPNDESVADYREKLDGIIMLMVHSGVVDLEINMERHRVENGSFVVIPYSAIFNLSASEPVDIRCVGFYADFLHNVNINFSAISLHSFVDRQSPAQHLNAAEIDIVQRYFEILHINADANVNEQIETNIAGSVMAALVYQLVQFHYARIGVSGSKGQRYCRNAYVHDFMKLVHVHYSRERSVGFYADKLCISPKYLSLLVKETTGRSAAKWIDEFVLMEAKNLLRFSGKNVQQVAYALNFSNILPVSLQPNTRKPDALAG